jgi:hypothetical protein
MTARAAHLSQSVVCHTARQRAFAKSVVASTEGAEQTLALRGVYEASIKDKVLDDLSRMRIDKLCGNSHCNEWKEMVKGWIGDVSAELKREIQATCPTDVQETMSASVDRICNVFKGLETEALERAALIQTVPFIKPVARKLGVAADFVVDAEGNKYSRRMRVSYAYDIPVAASLQRLMQYDTRAWAQIQATQQTWRENPPEPGSMDFTIADITHASVFREHPELGAHFRAQPDVEGVLHLPGDTAVNGAAV